MKKGKRPYQKPQIKEVKLIPEEAVLAHCKSSVGSNNKFGRCRSSAFCTAKTVGS